MELAEIYIRSVYKKDFGFLLNEQNLSKDFGL